MKSAPHLEDYTSVLRRLGIAIILGAGAACTVWLFHLTLLGLEWLLLDHRGGSLVNAAEHLPRWRRALTPAMGGLTAGFLLWLYHKYLNQHPTAPVDYIEAIDSGDGRLDFSASLVKCLASLFVVASGSAIGREGAMILLAALFASWFARKRTPPHEWKLWVACGTAAGMASAYHAPLAGSLFVAEVLFGTLMLSSLGPVVVAAVSALMVTSMLNGAQAPLYQARMIMPPVPMFYVLMGTIGIVTGLAGPLFLYLLQCSERFFRLLRLSPPLQLALGGLIVGLLSLRYPEVWGNGSSAVQEFLVHPLPGKTFIFMLLSYRLLAVLASGGSGAPGGVFTPTLFLGSALGALSGSILGALPFAGENTGILLTLTGMAAFLAATTHAPIMATIMVCEMTGEYTLLPGLLLACILATILSRMLRSHSIYR